MYHVVVEKVVNLQGAFSLRREKGLKMIFSTLLMVLAEIF